MLFRSTQNQQTLNTFYDGFGGGWRWRDFGGEGMSTTTTEVTKVGSVTVDIFDSHSQKLIWRGTDSDDLSSNADKNIQKLAKDLNNMFKKFPAEGSDVHGRERGYLRVSRRFDGKVSVFAAID